MVVLEILDGDGQRRGVVSIDPHPYFVPFRVGQLLSVAESGLRAVGWRLRPI